MNDTQSDTPQPPARTAGGPSDWTPYRGFLVRTEERGHGIVAVYIKGSADEIHKIQRASAAYARSHLTFAPGLSAVSGGGGEITDSGRTFISQDVYATQPLPPRQD